jgi:cytochrome c-type biogenesis protein CcmE
VRALATAPQPSAVRRRRRRTRWLAGLGVVAVALAYLVYQGLTNNLVYFQTPSEVRAAGAADVGRTLRVGGTVVPGSAGGGNSGQPRRFALADAHSQLDVVVAPDAAIPPLFRPGVGVVLEGTLQRDGSFLATTLIVAHGNQYTVPKSGSPPPLNNPFNQGAAP